MARTNELQQLLEDLKVEKPESHTVVQPDSKMLVVNDDLEDGTYTFTGEEAKLLLANRDTVDRLFESIGYPEEVFVEIHNITIDEEIMSALEQHASTVDEM
jgi:hypothetical protein